MKILLRCLDGIQKVVWVLALFDLGLRQVLAGLPTSGVADGVVFFLEHCATASTGETTRRIRKKNEKQQITRSLTRPTSYSRLLVLSSRV